MEISGLGESVGLILLSTFRGPTVGFLDSQVGMGKKGSWRMGLEGAWRQGPRQVHWADGGSWREMECGEPKQASPFGGGLCQYTWGPSSTGHNLLMLPTALFPITFRGIPISLVQQEPLIWNCASFLYSWWSGLFLCYFALEGSPWLTELANFDTKLIASIYQVLSVCQQLC